MRRWFWMEFDGLVGLSCKSKWNSSTMVGNNIWKHPETSPPSLLSLESLINPQVLPLSKVLLLQSLTTSKSYNFQVLPLQTPTTSKSYPFKVSPLRSQTISKSYHFKVLRLCFPTCGVLVFQHRQLPPSPALLSPESHTTP